MTTRQYSPSPWMPWVWVPAVFYLLSFGDLLRQTEAYSKEPVIFCYYSSYAQNRQGIGKFLPEDIDPTLCTHVIFAFADLVGGTSLKHSSYNDIPNGADRGLYARTVALKKRNPRIKILLALGGWRIGSEPFVPMVKSKQKRREFITNVVRYLRRHDFDGLDMDWEFPGTRGSGPEDKYHFTDLMKGLNRAFTMEARQSGRERLLLTMAAAGGSYFIKLAYEPEKIVELVDYILLMTYNYHGSWNKFTGHHSGLFPRSDEAGGEREWNWEWTIDFWLNKAGAPPEKVVVGIPTYGMSFKLASPRDHGLKAAADGGGDAGSITGEKGILAYYEICDNLQSGWHSVWIDEQKVPYAHHNDQWVGYDNIDSVTYKSRYIRELGLAGAFIWSVEMDDFSGACGTGKYPLLSTIARILRGGGGGGGGRIGSKADKSALSYLDPEDYSPMGLVPPSDQPANPETPPSYRRSPGYQAAAGSRVSRSRDIYAPDSSDFDYTQETADRISASELGYTSGTVSRTQVSRGEDQFDYDFADTAGAVATRPATPLRERYTPAKPSRRGRPVVGGYGDHEAVDRSPFEYNDPAPSPPTRARPAVAARPPSSSYANTQQQRAVSPAVRHDRRLREYPPTRRRNLATEPRESPYIPPRSSPPQSELVDRIRSSELGPVASRYTPPGAPARSSYSGRSRGGSRSSSSSSSSSSRDYRGARESSEFLDQSGYQTPANEYDRAGTELAASPPADPLLKYARSRGIIPRSRDSVDGASYRANKDDPTVAQSWQYFTPGLSCTRAGLFPHPRSCKQYYICLPHGKKWYKFHLTCPKDLGFKPDKAVCDRVENCTD